MLRSLSAICCLALGAIPARADLIISVGDAFLSPGGSGTLDVSIRSTTGSDILDSFGVELRITPSIGVAPRRLEFVSPPTDTQLTDPGYLFFGDSAGALAPPVGVILSALDTNDTYVGGDGTLSMLGVLVPTTDTLLLRLLVTAATSSPPLAGDSFPVTLQFTPNTFFFDPTFTSIPATSTAGLVTILGAPAAVPEPSSLALGIVGILCLSGRARRRWTQNRGNHPQPSVHNDIVTGWS